MAQTFPSKKHAVKALIQAKKASTLPQERQQIRAAATRQYPSLKNVAR